MMGPVKASASERTIRPDAVQPGTMSALRQLKVASVVNPEENAGGLVVVDPLGAPMHPRGRSLSGSKRSPGWWRGSR